MEEEEQDETPLKEPVKIREYSELQQHGFCMVCGQEREPYVQIEYGDKVEYTCEDCYRKSMGEPVQGCRECGAALKDGDKFCSKCGAEQELGCTECGAEITGKDTFCGRCGTKL
ncbi:MAG: zinc-ribbon domain-containing protein [Thermoplasmata archaeon]